MSAPLRYALTLGVHPTGRGFGWVAFEGPFAPYDWGVVGVDRDKNAVCLLRIEALLDRLKPETLVLEAFEGRRCLRSRRLVRLYKAVVGLAADRGIDVAIFSLAEVRSCFVHVGAVSRQEIAEAVVRHVDALRHRLPKKRKPWQSEDRRMSLFSAAALVLTQYQFDAVRLLRDLGDRSG